ncbi:GGDEF domain-containing protein [Intestinibacillus massiliensis]|uniref:GGDEF domain-containing protein n=1 Tax=Intestinibacillus massiliensis TaxID=1871029 RepID=UPI000B361045|nr:GGDEF domain-containing protein [Intestinibacillus massiliensis]
MSNIFAVLSDLVVILFDLLVYSMIFALKKETPLYRFLMYGGCGVILFFYFAGVHLWGIPASIASTLFMTIPSFLLFLALSRHKGSRFLLTFCFVDTVSLMIAFLGRYVGIMIHGGAVLAFVVVVAISITLLAIGRGRFSSYHVLLDTVDSGWGAMALATVLIYFALIFFAAYPKPMLERPEYAPCWLVFALVVLACYGVFLQSIHKTMRIQEQNQKLEHEKHLFQMVYTDTLTRLYNRAAYVEHINDLEREGTGSPVCCIMLDCNHFKEINDRFGHHSGDMALQKTADALRLVFANRTDSVFRIGGDEFAVMLPDGTVEEAASLLAQFEKEMEAAAQALHMPLSAAAGYAATQPGESIENAFIRADAMMYRNKKCR